MRIPLFLLTEEKKDLILRTLHFQAEHSYHDIVRNKKFGAPLPDNAVDCFIYNKEDGYLDVPFMIGRHFYQSNNLNMMTEKGRIAVEFTGKIRDEQIGFLEEAKVFLDKFDCVLLQARPGFGKTFCATHLSLFSFNTTLVVVNRIALLKQWKDTILNNTTGKVWVVGEPVPTYKVDFIVGMVDSLNKMDRVYLLKIGTLILDEAHMLATPKQIPAILRVRPVKLILCTATPDRDKRTIQILNSLVTDCRVIRRYDGFLKVIKFHTNIYIEQKQLVRQKGIDWADYVKKQQLSVERNQQVVEFVKKNLHFKILIMTWGREHAPHLSSLISQEGIKSDWMSKNKKSYKDGNVLVGSFGKIAVGFDPSSTNNWDQIHFDLLLMIGTTKDLTLIEQLWGRTFRSKFPHIVVFIDLNKKSEDHFKEMNKIVKLYQAELLETQTIFSFVKENE